MLPRIKLQHKNEKPVFAYNRKEAVYGRVKDIAEALGYTEGYVKQCANQKVPMGKWNVCYAYQNRWKYTGTDGNEQTLKKVEDCYALMTIYDEDFVLKKYRAWNKQVTEWCDIHGEKAVKIL